MTEERSEREFLPLVFIVNCFKKPLLIKNFKPKKSFDHPRHLKSGVPPWGETRRKIIAKRCQFVENFRVLLLTSWYVAERVFNRHLKAESELGDP